MSLRHKLSRCVGFHCHCLRQLKTKCRQKEKAGDDRRGVNSCQLLPATRFCMNGRVDESPQGGWSFFHHGPDDLANQPTGWDLHQAHGGTGWLNEPLGQSKPSNGETKHSKRDMAGPWLVATPMEFMSVSQSCCSTPHPIVDGAGVIAMQVELRLTQCRLTHAERGILSGSFRPRFVEFGAGLRCKRLLTPGCRGRPWASGDKGQAGHGCQLPGWLVM